MIERNFAPLFSPPVNVFLTCVRNSRMKTFNWTAAELTQRLLVPFLIRTTMITVIPATLNLSVGISRTAEDKLCYLEPLTLNLIMVNRLLGRFMAPARINRSCLH